MLLREPPQGHRSVSTECQLGNIAIGVQLQSCLYSGAEGRKTTGLLLSLSLSQLIRLALGSSWWNGNGFSSKQPVLGSVSKSSHTRTPPMLSVVWCSFKRLQGGGTYFHGQQSSRPCSVLVACQPTHMCNIV